MTLCAGSTWRKWDLHVHTPASGLNNQFPRTKAGEPDWESYIAKLESLHDVGVIGISDYFTIEGYRKVLEYRAKGRLPNISLLLPNIEFRLDKIVGSRRLNYHVIFSDEVSPDEIDEHFLQELKFCYEGDPQRPDLSWSIRRANIELLGKRLKQEHAKFANRGDFEIGCVNATVSSELIKSVLENKAQLFRGRYLIVLAEENTALMEWDGQDHLTRKVLLQGADAIFTSNPKTVAWARGEAGLSPAQFRAEFKSLKPCVHGSDAHALDKVACADKGRYCWIKADTTFEGLKQVLYEPKERVFIGDAPEELKLDQDVISSVTIEDAGSWFAPVDVPLNASLVTIIGPRGSGKSALAEAVAFAGGAELFRKPGDLSDTFVLKASRRSAANTTPITGAKVVLKWRTGQPQRVVLDHTLRHGLEEERVKYLPQRFVERLCAPENNGQLEERAIYQRIAKTDRGETSNFGELRNAAAAAVQLKRSKLTRNLQELNQSIADAQARIALKPGKESEAKRTREALELLLKNVPKVPEENQRDVQRLEELTKEKQLLEANALAVAGRMRALEIVETKVAGLKEDLSAYNAEMKELLTRAGIAEEAERFEVHPPAVATEILAGQRAKLTAMADILARGDGTEKSPASLASIASLLEECRTQSTLTETKKNEYARFQREKQRLEDAAAVLEREIKEIEEVIGPRAKLEAEARDERYVDGLELVKEERAVFEKLYEPLRGALVQSNETAKKLSFVSRITFDAERHASRGMELLDRRRAAYREEDELCRALRQFFGEIEAAGFERASTRRALASLRDSFVNAGGTRLLITSQLRKDRTAKEFADWFYALDTYDVTYSLTFDGKDLELLSPGEKGVVLLLLYLEAENADNRPLVVDQPDDNLDNMSVYPSLVEYFRSRKKARQVIIIIHNPNLVVNTDAEQVIVADFDGSRAPRISYSSGALEDPVVRELVCKVLEGGADAFRLREQRYALAARQD